MKSLIYMLCLPLVLACQKDETISGFTDPATLWTLVEMNGLPVRETITLSFPEQGKIAGRAPCNRYFASQGAPYPWLDIGPIGSTRRACAALELETRYLSLLGAMTLVEVSGPVLILSDEEGPKLVFNSSG